MSKYDDLFEDVTGQTSVFAEKQALDPLARPDEIIARDDQEWRLARIIGGIDEGYLPSTVSVYGPPGTGKTVTVRRIGREFARRRDDLAVEYVNLKECRSRFSIANEILMELTGERLPAYEGLDGVFDAIWKALEDYPEWTVLVLDEIDHIKQDANYEPSDFFYRLLRGEGRQKRGLNLSVVTISNELLEVDLRLDSRVRSAMSGEEVFFPPYGREELRAILTPKLDRAFKGGALPDDVLTYGVGQAASRWGDARKAVTLFRRAGETADERGLEVVTKECVDDNLEATDREAVVEKITRLPETHVAVLAAIVSWSRGGQIVQPVTTSKVYKRLHRNEVPETFQLEQRRIRELVDDLEMMALVDTWVESQGNQGRVKQIRTAINPDWIREAQEIAAKQYQVVISEE